MGKDSARHTQNLVILVSLKGAILAHIPPRRQNSDPNSVTGDELAREMVQKINIKLSTLKDSMTNGPGGVLVYAVNSQGTQMTASHKKILESALNTVWKLPTRSIEYTVPIPNTAGKGKVVIDARNHLELLVVWVEDKRHYYEPRLAKATATGPSRR